MRNLFICLLFFAIMSYSSFAQKATIHEEMMEMNTYMFSDPDPVANIGRIYPYFYFHGYTNTPELKKWKMVVLENDYIKVFVCPDVGGKIWGAIEKSTGKEFLYYNHVVKFRDVAMRGAWTSGGLEFNFGDIGHIPTCATPVDYVMKNNVDGSVSCVVGAIDLPSGTKWNVEIIVHPDKAYFETLVKWFNNTPLQNTYYHWMNAAAKSSGNLEFIYPGSNWIGHGEELGEWPIDKGREINYYENNNFGSYKSYHVLNSYSEFFGGYYHDDNFGFGHLSNYDEKPGKKLWIWGLSKQGMIWEDLLTDSDGQYIEFQAGKLFNQAAANSTATPFKHREFTPHDTDVMHEIWFPLKETGGMVAAYSNGVINIEDNDGRLKVTFGALTTVKDKLIFKEDGKIVKEVTLNLSPLENINFDYKPANDHFDISLKSGKHLYSSNPENSLLERPLSKSENFNWESGYGYYIKGLEFDKQRNYKKARENYILALAKDHGLLPALTRLAFVDYREMDYQKSLETVKEALRIDTYDPEANYLYGLLNNVTGKNDESKSGFSIAAAALSHRPAAYTELSKIFFREGDFKQSIDYARKALSFNIYNISAYKLFALNMRKTGNVDESKYYLDRIFELDATDHFVRYERYINGAENGQNDFESHITNELPFESYMDLASFYLNLGLQEDALTILKMAPENQLVNIWLAGLVKDSDEYLKKLVQASPQMVFPHRTETAFILEDLVKQNDNWKLRYYLGLIYWNKGRSEKALALFESCGDQPDFAPFYLSLAKLTDDKAKREHCLKKAFELDKKDWRPALALVDSYLSSNRPKEALPVVKEYLGKYPEQPAIGLAYARTLMSMEEYVEAISFLENYNLLPFEGATIGRDLFHEACIRVAMNELDNKKYKKAISAATKALTWPENLGVGEPYDVDERLENWLISKGYAGLKKYDKEKEYVEKVAGHQNEVFPNESSRLIFQLLAMKKLGDVDDSKKLLDKIVSKYPDNQYVKWAGKVFASKDDLSEAIDFADRVLNSGVADDMPYNTDYKDLEFKLVTDFFRNK